MGTALEKHNIFGFGVQDAEGSQETGTIYWAPVNDSWDFGENPNLTVYRQADNTSYAHLMYSAGRWWEGGAPFAIYPSAAVIAELIDWIQTRDAYNQGKFASVYRWQRDTGVIEAAMDVKVRRATFRFDKGRPVSMALDLVGKKAGSSPALGTPDAYGPFLFNEATVTSNWAAGSLTADVNFENLEISIDNMIEDPSEGLRLTADPNIQKLYNDSGQDCTGSTTLDFIAATQFALWRSMMTDNFSTTYDAQVAAVLARGGVNITFTVNRCKFNDWSANPRGSNQGRVPQTITFQALGSDDGATGPITLS